MSVLRTALIDTINANVADQLVSYETAVDVVEVPAMMVIPQSTNYMVTAGATTIEELYIFVMCQRNDTQLGQVQLDGYIANAGPDSIPQAVNQNDNLGLANCRAEIYAMHGYGGSFTIAGIPHVGAILKCRVLLDP